MHEKNQQTTSQQLSNGVLGKSHIWLRKVSAIRARRISVLEQSVSIRKKWTGLVQYVKEKKEKKEGNDEHEFQAVFDKRSCGVHEVKC